MFSNCFGFYSFGNVVNDALKREHFFRSGVWNFDFEFLLKLDDKLNRGHGIECVHSQIFNEAIVGLELGKVNDDVPGKYFPKFGGYFGAIWRKIAVAEFCFTQRRATSHVGKSTLFLGFIGQFYSISTTNQRSQTQKHTQIPR